MDAKQEVTSYLRLRLNTNDMLVPLSQVQIVLPVAQLDTIPNADLAFVGLLDFHSEIIPIYHLSSLINAPQPVYDLNTPILICSIPNQSLGLLVSDVVEILTVNTQSIKPSGYYQSQPYVVGTWEDDKHTLCLLDVEKLMTHHKQLMGNTNEYIIPSS